MKNKSSKKQLAIFVFGAVFAAVIFGVSSAHAINFKYTPMEKIPGFEDVNISDFPTLIQTIYKFALWVAGICALFMISVGGYSYMTSAGNTSKAGVGKQIITDALIGLVLVLIAVLIFSVINPSLTTINLQISPTAGPAPTAPAGAPTAPISHNLTEDQRIRDQFSAAGITVNRNCSSTAPSTCVDGLPEKVINELINLRRTSGCAVQVTGGTEGRLGGHGPSCHNPGQSCVDISRNLCLNNHFTSEGLTSVVASRYGIRKICVDNQDSQFPKSRMCYNCCRITEGESHFHFSF